MRKLFHMTAPVVPAGDSCTVSSISPSDATTKASEQEHAYGILIMTAIYAAILTLIAGLYLLSPKPNGRKFCGETVQLARRLSFPLNCDSMEFIDEAIMPSSLLKRGSERQERPLFVTAAAVPTQLLIHSRFWRLIPEHIINSISASPAFHDHYAKHHLSIAWSEYPHDSLCAYVSYIALNGIVVIGSLLLFNWLTIGTWKFNGTVVAFASLLLATDVVKAFFWSPHTQMFNLLVPLGAVLLCEALIRVPNRSLRSMWTFGFVTGIFTLAYGSFPVLILAGLFGLASHLVAQKDRILWSRFGAQSLALIAGLVLPSGIWITLCKVVAGEYHNRELSVYHQFIWIWESARLGWSELLWQSEQHCQQFIAALLPVLYFPLLLLFGTVLFGVALRVPVRLIYRERSSTFIAIAFTTFVCLIYFYLLGTYRERLALNIVLPLILASAILAVGIVERVARPFPAALVQTSVWCLVLVRFVYQIGKAGPWSS